MSLPKDIKFTILIACKNEEKDIRLAADSALAQTYPHKEIIFIDDSTDRTKEIIQEYLYMDAILLDGPGTGCCEARNLGMRQASGDVIVFLTADTKLEPNYLEKILPYYERGYDMVMTEGFSYNMDSVYSRFIQFSQLKNSSCADFNPFTTQGYSVRKEAALAVGLITGGDYPVNFCRDWTLAKKMLENGFNQVVDRSIIVPHKSPDNLGEYWMVQKTRGLMSAYQPYFLFHRTPFYLYLKFTAKSALSFLHFALFFPALFQVIGLSKYSKNPIRDFFPLFWAYFLHVLARCVGEWSGWLFIIKYNRSKF
ncbi:glycosyltransferase [Shewanella sp.]|uniref:glycosyltransferase n=1 Tax=Shewanella sp. TaxID=50422 RepID=UPI004047719A